MAALLGLHPSSTAPGGTGLIWVPDTHTVTSAPTVSEHTAPKALVLEGKHGRFVWDQ